MIVWEMFYFSFENIGCKTVFFFFFFASACLVLFLLQTNEGAYIKYLSSTLYNDGSFVLFCDQL